MARTRDNPVGVESKKESSSSSRKTASGKKKNGSTGVWPCTINGCNKQFAREADLKRHQRTTKLHATSVAGSQCPQCDATFTRTDALRRHQKSRHNGVVIEPDYELSLEERVDGSEGEDNDDNDADNDDERSTPSRNSECKSPSVSTHVSSTRLTKSLSVDSVDPAQYSGTHGSFPSRPIMTAHNQYPQAAPSAFPPAPRRDCDDDYDSSSDEEPMSGGSAGYSHHHYPNHLSAPSSHHYWGPLYSATQPSSSGIRSRRDQHGPNSHWRTSSQRTTASLEDSTDVEASYSGSEEAGPSSTPATSPTTTCGDDKFQAISLELSVNQHRDARHATYDLHPYSSSSSSSRSSSRSEDRYMSGYSNHYLREASSLRTTQLYYPPQPRHQDSATRSTVLDGSLEPDQRVTHTATNSATNTSRAFTPHHRHYHSEPKSPRSPNGVPTSCHTVPGASAPVFHPYLHSQTRGRSRQQGHVVGDGGRPSNVHELVTPAS